MQIQIVKANGTSELFIPSKLERSLRRAGATEDAIEKVISEITKTITPGITTKKIYETAFRLMKNVEKKGAVGYSLRKAVMDLGPSGFPFEEFISRIMSRKGFETKVGVMLNGRCIEHEVDVMALNEKELILIEAKFHNKTGFRTDAKVAMYVWARFEDLGGQQFKIGELQRSMSEGWLVTNTKFTSSAIKYGECKNLKMIGWNYPEKENLFKMIEEEKLYPITILSSLSLAQKQSLISLGMVLCKDVLEHKDILDSVITSESKKENVLEEARLICLS